MDEILKNKHHLRGFHSLMSFEKRKHGFRKNHVYYVIDIVANFIFREIVLLI